METIDLFNQNKLWLNQLNYIYKIPYHLLNIFYLKFILLNFNI